MRQFKPYKTEAPRYDGELITGLPSAAMVLTNSERREAWCSRRWLFSYGRLINGLPSIAMQWGSFYHTILEDMYLHWGENGLGYSETCLYVCGGAAHVSGLHTSCRRCGGGGLGPLARISGELQSDPEYWDRQAEKYGGIDGLLKSLLDTAVGYLHVYGINGPKDFDVLAVEVPVALPVLNESGKVYKSQVPIVDLGEGKGWRLASFREKMPWRMIRLPWYQIGRLDCLLRHKVTKDLYVLEFKTSANPTSYGKDLHLDNQLPGYIAAAEYLNLGNVKGYIWDVSSSRKQAEPRVLASGKISTAKQNCPSWKYKEAVDLIISGQSGSTADYSIDDVSKLKDFVKQLRQTVDPKLFHREWGNPAKSVIDRYKAELLVDAQRFAKMRRALVSAPTEEAVLSSFPRVPFCRGPGSSCSYAGICMEGGSDLDLVIDSMLSSPNTGKEKRDEIHFIERENKNTTKENKSCPMF